MACFHPLKAFYRVNSETGKKVIVFAKTKDDKIGYDGSGNVYGIPIDIPCGQCRGCRLEYSRQWAVRCVLEAMQYEHNYFVTLTYNDDNLPIQDNFQIDKLSGEVLGHFQSSSLVPDHLTKFMKDLRAYFKYHFDYDNIRFFACGEYGEKFMRPHFHIILFNCPIPDLDLLKTSFNGDVYWRSQILDKLWNKGFVCVGSCNFSTCSYVARYMMKKQKGKNSDFYFDLGLLPPFTRCSRMPGIAKSYYDANSDKIYDYDQLVIVGSDGTSKKVKPPKYFDRLYDIQCPEDLKRIKECRSESAKNSMDRKLEHTSLDKDTYLAVCESNLIAKTNKLIRPIE